MTLPLPKLVFWCHSFQEVVPLNAGNVLGAEDNRPIPRWEAIIRRTLNKTSEPKTKHKSFSAPPSPVFKPSLADTFPDEHVTTAVNKSRRQSLNFYNATDIQEYGQSLPIDEEFQMPFLHENDTDWPERSLDTTVQIYPSSSRLRRVSSSSGRMGFGWTDDSLYFSPRNLAVSDCAMSTMFGDTACLGPSQRPQDPRLESLNYLSDALERFPQEEDPFSIIPEMEPAIATAKECTKSRPGYVRIISKQMVGIYVSIWVRRRLRRHINNLKVLPVGVGLMGFMGNKVCNLFFCIYCSWMPIHVHYV